jgi:hypothetical protein
MVVDSSLGFEVGSMVVDSSLGFEVGSMVVDSSLGFEVGNRFADRLFGVEDTFVVVVGGHVNYLESLLVESNMHQADRQEVILLIIPFYITI